ncbi:hypothetical protein KSP39_PZI001975 [Platanthera zijinensis]|uniref:Uncharacterized protein n=1 Tax=Platanthera zijinensis TaxID=2320716 RepID=A0AAP0GDR3_9ASPA
MGGKQLSAADCLLGTGDFSSGFISGSDLPELGEEDIWGNFGTPTPSAGNRWLRRRLGGSDATTQDPGVRGRCRCRTAAATAKSAPVSVPKLARTGRSVEEAEAEEWVPPHEYVARVHGKTAVATSVFEGVGRTLKGRDLSRVRDTVWSQTGFFG